MHFGDPLQLVGTTNVQKLVNFCKMNKFHFNWQWNIFADQAIVMGLTITSYRINRTTQRKETFVVKHDVKCFFEKIEDFRMSIEKAKELLSCHVLSDIFSFHPEMIKPADTSAPQTFTIITETVRQPFNVFSGRSKWQPFRKPDEQVPDEMSV
jgi:hypothetical protein